MKKIQNYCKIFRKTCSKICRQYGWKISCSGLGILLIASIFTNGFGLKDYIWPTSSKEIANKAMNFINNSLLEDTSASLVGSNCLKNVGLCEFEVDIQGRTFKSYVSDDGKLLFPEAIEIKEEEISQAGQINQSIEISKTDKPTAVLYVMSYCPFGNQAEEIMNPVQELLGNQADIRLGYVIYSNYAEQMGGKSEEWCLSSEEKYCSMHGRGELDQGIRELCVQKYQPDKLWDFIKETNQQTSANNINQKWEGIARQIGIDVNQVKTCQIKEGEKFLSQELAANQQYNIQGSPALLINGVIYKGDRSSDGYKQAICSAFNTPPSECQIILDSPDATNSGSCG